MNRQAGPDASVIPAVRRRAINRRPWRADGAHVVYWMTMSRRLDYNQALERAAELARHFDRPLIIFEPLRLGYRWASARLHAFVLDGMREHRDRLHGQRVAYYPYVEPAAGAGKGLLAALAMDACGVVTDDYPAFFLPHMLARAGTRLEVRLEAVDANGLLPLRAADRVYPTAHAFRRFLHRALPDALLTPPAARPLRGAPLPQARLPEHITARWAPAAEVLDDRGVLSRLPIDHEVGPAALRGGTSAARSRLEAWLADGVSRYADDRSQPLSGAASGLSPWLHFGHIAAWEVFAALSSHERWDPRRLGRPSGARQGWWGMRESAEAFLDELVTWRELGFNQAAHDPQGWTGLGSLPAWAQHSLETHADDRREWAYRLEELAGARTHDVIWNAAQRQLVAEGVMENYLRMLWGKKILEWSPDPRRALETMVELNNRYALDGRDPNSWSGILWCLGKFDRPWGPERPVFGTVRYMSSASTRRKFDLGPYLKQWGGDRTDDNQLDMDVAN